MSRTKLSPLCCIPWDTRRGLCIQWAQRFFTIRWKKWKDASKARQHWARPQHVNGIRYSDNDYERKSLPQRKKILIFGSWNREIYPSRAVGTLDYQDGGVITHPPKKYLKPQNTAWGFYNSVQLFKAATIWPVGDSPRDLCLCHILLTLENLCEHEENCLISTEKSSSFVSSSSSVSIWWYFSDRAAGQCLETVPIIQIFSF